MTPVEQGIGVFVLLVIMAVPRLAQSLRALGAVVLTGAAVVLALWFGWVEQLPQGLGNVGQAIAVALAAAAFGIGVLVRAVVLVGRRREWLGAVEAGLSLAAVAMAGLGLMGFFDML